MKGLFRFLMIPAFILLVMLLAGMQPPPAQAEERRGIAVVATPGILEVGMETRVRVLVTAAGGPVAGADVYMGAEAVPRGVTDGEGKAEFSLLRKSRGPVEIRVTAADCEPASFLLYAVSRGEGLIEVVPRKEQGDPLEGFRAQVGVPGRSRPYWEDDTKGDRVVLIAPEGEVEVAAARPGKPGYYMMGTIEVEPLTRQRLFLGGPGLASLTVQGIYGQEPLAEAVVKTWPEGRDSLGWVVVGETDAAGRFQGFVSPGTYGISLGKSMEQVIIMTKTGVEIGETAVIDLVGEANRLGFMMVQIQGDGFAADPEALLALQVEGAPWYPCSQELPGYSNAGDFLFFIYSHPLWVSPGEHRLRWWEFQLSAPDNTRWVYHSRGVEELNIPAGGQRLLTLGGPLQARIVTDRRGYGPGDEVKIRLEVLAGGRPLSYIWTTAGESNNQPAVLEIKDPWGETRQKLELTRLDRDTVTWRVPENPLGTYTIEARLDTGPYQGLLTTTETISIGPPGEE